MLISRHTNILFIYLNYYTVLYYTITVGRSCEMAKKKKTNKEWRYLIIHPSMDSYLSTAPQLALLSS